MLKVSKKGQYLGLSWADVVMPKEIARPDQLGCAAVLAGE
jgi:hypothetical protein